MDYSISEMTLDRYEELTALWRSTEGLWPSDDDDYENLQRFFKRNPGLSLVALHEDRIIGALKCSHDGRRGYLHHLAVRKDFRNYGIGRELVERCIQNLREEGIKKVRVFVLDINDAALEFWKNLRFDVQASDYSTLEYDG